MKLVATSAYPPHIALAAATTTLGYAHLSPGAHQLDAAQRLDVPAIVSASSPSPSEDARNAIAAN
jgi:hypothetical protein